MLITQLTSLDPAIKEGMCQIIHGVVLPDESLTILWIAVLPKGSQVSSVSKHGLSLWTSTFKVVTRGSLGELASYFLKVRK